MPLAQFNIARTLYPHGDPRLADFFDNVPRMNALAERSPGFLWRLKDDSAAVAALFADEPRMTMTLSLWQDLDSLRHFTFKTLHRVFHSRTKEWFEPLGAAYLVIWEVPEGHRPDHREAWEALQALRANGPTATRFGTETLVTKEPAP